MSWKDIGAAIVINNITNRYPGMCKKSMIYSLSITSSRAPGEFASLWKVVPKPISEVQEHETFEQTPWSLGTGHVVYAQFIMEKWGTGRQSPSSLSGADWFAYDRYAMPDT